MTDQTKRPMDEKRQEQNKQPEKSPSSDSRSQKEDKNYQR